MMFQFICMSHKVYFCKLHEDHFMNGLPTIFHTQFRNEHSIFILLQHHTYRIIVGTHITQILLHVTKFIVDETFETDSLISCVNSYGAAYDVNKSSLHMLSSQGATRWNMQYMRHENTH